jgi:hypothetical protein
MGREVWLDWQHIRSHRAEVDDHPVTATRRARVLQEEVCFETYLDTPTTAERLHRSAMRKAGRGLAQRVGFSEEDLEELAEAFWQGAEPRLRKKHPDCLPSRKTRKEGK